ncbi:3'-5' exonuclease [Gelatiniphilus marinus]|uniref:3'-5' exonuclease n=1 Tax=Gelatiniphilus marinus TaxID=1759464 RepID=A0ABW5JWG1_9FLAO
MNNSNLAEIYKNRIKSLLDKEYYNINSIDGVGYFGKTYEELKNLKPTEKEIFEFRKLKELNSNTQEYKDLYRKLSIWRILDSCVDKENNSIADLIDKINLLQKQEENQNNQKNKYEYLLFFDTETTGIPKNWKAPITDLNNWPRIVQLAYILSDKDGKIINQSDFIIKPVDFKIPEESSNVHGITTDKAIEEGIPLSLALQSFDNLAKHSGVLVAHNIEFDEKIVRAEYLRCNMTDSLSNMKRICTMEESINLCALKGTYGYKWPKLTELYFKLFNSELKDSHNASNDVKATFECYWELKKRKII